MWTSVFPHLPNRCSLFNKISTRRKAMLARAKASASGVRLRLFACGVQWLVNYAQIFQCYVATTGTQLPETLRTVSQRKERKTKFEPV